MGTIDNIQLFVLVGLSVPPNGVSGYLVDIYWLGLHCMSFAKAKIQQTQVCQVSQNSRSSCDAMASLAEA